MPKKKNPVGRPAWVMPDLVEVERIASLGLTQEQIAHSLGIALGTLCEKKKQYSEFNEAIKRGQASGIKKMANVVFDNAVKGESSSAMFYLKCRAGWREKQEIDLNANVENRIIIHHEYGGG